MVTRSDTQNSTALQDRTQGPTPWNVVLIDDDEHTYEYVIRVLQELFRWDRAKAFKVAQTVDEEGRAVLVTTHKELAELRAEQVNSFGRDPLIRASQGGMTCVIEPAEFGDDGDDASNDESHGASHADSGRTQGDSAEGATPSTVDRD
ncbi:MAG: ATP-dependent Clp protease adaptor ClpS [Planctomycetota bacterium]|nr:ATP-dependent Clp protease adaptor ClpS [Planctomycetota bacterium]